MNKEFSVDKWLKEHLPPKVAGLFILLLVVFAIGSEFVPLHYRQIAFTVCLVLMAAVVLIGFSITIWSLIWSIKHPLTREYCKECGQLKPLKYDKD